MDHLEIKKAMAWSLITGTEHPALDLSEFKIENLKPIVGILFPGANYYSTTGFSQIMRSHAMPALKKLFPEIVELSSDQITQEETVEIAGPFLPSKGYEWQDSKKWQKKFDVLIAA